MLCECYPWCAGVTLGVGWNIKLSRFSDGEHFVVTRLDWLLGLTRVPRVLMMTNCGWSTSAQTILCSSL